MAPVSIFAENVEVVSKTRRRQFTAKYKRELLRRADACTKPGELGAILRAEGLYSSHLALWRKASERGELAGLAPRKRGPKAVVPDARDKRILTLERDNARLSARAEREEALVQVVLQLVSPTPGVKT